MNHFFWLVSLANALTPKEIVVKALEQHTPTQLHQSVEMTINRANGRSQKRHFELDLLRTENVFFTRATFTEPSAVKGTVVLVHDHAQKEDEVFMYMPALKRVQKIQSKGRQGGFMGSDFSFDDLQLRSEDATTFTLLSETAEHVEIRATFPASDTWSALEIQVDQKTHLPTRIAFQNEQGETEKTLIINNTVDIDGQTFPAQTTMTNHQTGFSTILLLSNIQPQSDHLDVPYFHPDKLGKK